MNPTHVLSAIVTFLPHGKLIRKAEDYVKSVITTFK